MILAMMAAQSEQKAPKAEMLRLYDALTKEHEAHGFWPKGF